MAGPALCRAAQSSEGGINCLTAAASALEPWAQAGSLELAQQKHQNAFQQHLLP